MRIGYELYHIVDSVRVAGTNSDLRGDCSGLRGDCSGLSGNCSGLWGDCSDLWGDLDYCNITDEERARGIDIADLVMKQ